MPVKGSACIYTADYFAAGNKCAVTHHAPVPQLSALAMHMDMAHTFSN